jgi:hypothetical protein
MNGPHGGTAEPAGAGAPAALRSFYAWMALLAAGVLAACVAFGVRAEVIGGIATGALMGFVVVGSWHWILGARRPLWAYVALFAAKYVLVFGGSWLLVRAGVADPAGVVGGLAILVVAALPLAVAAWRMPAS